MSEEERKDYLKYIENYTINDLADIFNTQNFVIQDKDKFNEILLYYHFKQNEEIEQLQQENQELKKQLEEINKFKFSYRKDETKIPPVIRKQKDVETIKKLENQQKEFIEWLENEKNIYPYDISDYVYENIINTILSKYYEIIEK